MKEQSIYELYEAHLKEGYVSRTHIVRHSVVCVNLRLASVFLKHAHRWTDIKVCARHRVPECGCVCAALWVRYGQGEREGEMERVRGREEERVRERERDREKKREREGWGESEAEGEVWNHSFNPFANLSATKQMKSLKPAEPWQKRQVDIPISPVSQPHSSLSLSILHLWHLTLSTKVHD